MYRASTRVELPGIVEKWVETDVDGGTAVRPVYSVEPRILEPGDAISKADLGKVQTAESIAELVEQGALEDE